MKKKARIEANGKAKPKIAKKEREIASQRKRNQEEKKERNVKKEALIVTASAKISKTNKRGFSSAGNIKFPISDAL